MSGRLNCTLLVRCAFGLSLFSGVSSTLLAGDVTGEHSHTTPAVSADGRISHVTESKPISRFEDQSKMSHGLMNHDQMTITVE